MIWWPTEIPELRYGKIRLRRPNDGDIQSIFEACQDPEIPRFTRVPQAYTLDHAKDFVFRVTDSLELIRELPFVIEYLDGSDYKFAGVISLHTIRATDHCAEVGYWMEKSMRGKGICSDATKLITDYALRTIGFRRIEAMVDIANTGSQKVLERAEFEKEGLVKQKTTRQDGTQIDMVSYAAITATWPELK